MPCIAMRSTLSSSLFPRAPLAPAGARLPSPSMMDHADPLTRRDADRRSIRFEVRSVTGACYTLVEETDRDDTGAVARRRYRTAYAGLPVVANDDGSFTIVDTNTRLVLVDRR